MQALIQGVCVCVCVTTSPTNFCDLSRSSIHKTKQPVTQVRACWMTTSCSGQRQELPWVCQGRPSARLLRGPVCRYPPPATPGWGHSKLHTLNSWTQHTQPGWTSWASPVCLSESLSGIFFLCFFFCLFVLFLFFSGNTRYQKHHLALPGPLNSWKRSTEVVELIHLGQPAGVLPESSVTKVICKSNLWNSQLPARRRVENVLLEKFSH